MCGALCISSPMHALVFIKGNEKQLLHMVGYLEMMHYGSMWQETDERHPAN